LERSNFHHQESQTLYTQQQVFVMQVMLTASEVILTSLADSQHNLHDKYLLLCIQCLRFLRWKVDLSKTCRVLYQNKFEK
jgi:hypothetical protein